MRLPPKLQNITNWLDIAEKRFRALSIPKLNESSQRYLSGESQFFAWYENEESENEDVVICIGSNYGQIDPSKPELPCSHFPTKCILKPWFLGYKRAAASVAENLTEWRKHKWISENASPPKNPRLFIMTNIVPWVTTKLWSSIPKRTTENLIQYAKEHYHYKKANAFLRQLSARTSFAFAVGHGVNHKIRSHLPEFTAYWEKYMLYANLTFAPKPRGWDEALERFKF